MSMKRITKLTGVPVCENPKYVLNILYGKILRALSNYPTESAYRQYTQEIVASRSFIVNNCVSVCEIEEQINSGIAEELIIQAENELRLVRSLVRFKPWEPLIAVPSESQWKWPPANVT